MEWHLYKADKSRKKWSIRGTRFDGVDVKLPGHRDKKVADEIRRHVHLLNRAKALNEPPTAELVVWLDNQPEKFVTLLVEHKLVDQRRLDRRLPLEDFLPEYEEVLIGTVRKEDSRHPKHSTQRIRRVLRSIKGLKCFEDLTVDAVMMTVPKLKVLCGPRKGELLSAKSQHEHYAAMIQFIGWMKTKGRFLVNPLENLKLPSFKDNRVRNRRPLSYADFDKLMAYLETAENFPHQRFPWTARDRAMLYWAAVTTGFRQQELLSLTRANFDFEASPATVTVFGRHTKNGCTDTIPIPADFAAKIDEYTSHHLPNTPVFNAPRVRYSITLTLYRDLDAAGVKRTFANGDTVDFHTFRSTAICWWLRSGLKLLEVQFLSRLRTLDLIQEYVRRYVPDYGDLVKNAPKIAGPCLDQRMIG